MRYTSLHCLSETIFGWSPTPLYVTPIRSTLQIVPVPLALTSCMVKWLLSHGMNYKCMSLQRFSLKPFIPFYTK